MFHSYLKKRTGTCFVATGLFDQQSDVMKCSLKDARVDVFSPLDHYSSVLMCDPTTHSLVLSAL